MGALYTRAPLITLFLILGLASCEGESAEPNATGPESAVPSEPDKERVREGDRTPDPPAAIQTVEAIKPQTLEEALNGIESERELARIAGKGAEWVVVAAEENEKGLVTTVHIMRQTAAALQVQEYSLPLSTDSTPESEAEVDLSGAKIQLVDLDDDGVEEAVVLVDWSRHVIWSTPALDEMECEHGACFLEASETIKTLIVLGQKETPLLTHILLYETVYSGSEEIDSTPDPEQIAYDVNLGRPAFVELKRLKFKISEDRPAQWLIDPATDPLFAAGEERKFLLDLAGTQEEQR